VAGHVFSWRQVVSGVAGVAVIVGVLPVVVGALDGAWGLPAGSVEAQLAPLGHPDPAAYRMLWIGDPRALPMGGWSAQAGLAYALSGENLPDTTAVWTPSGPGPADTAGDALRLAMAGNTVHLGRLLAPLGVRYLVVVDGVDPAGSNQPASVAAPPPAGLQRALLNQDDLQAVPGQSGIQLYENSETVPVTAERADPTLASSPLWSFPSAQDVAGWHPVLSPLTGRHVASGTISAGTVFAGYAPAGAFSLEAGSGAVARVPAFGWAAQYPHAPAGTATLAFHRFPYVPLFVVLELLAWLVLAAALLGWRRGLRPRGADRGQGADRAQSADREVT
jgi:hypothetical protein